MLVAVCEWTNEFLLHISFRFAKVESIISGELLQQTNFLVQLALLVDLVGVLQPNGGGIPSPGNASWS
jgi:hypothetical protein